MLVVGSVACILLAVVVFAVSAIAFKQQTVENDDQSFGDIQPGNPAAVPTPDAPKSDPVYFEMAKEGNLTRLHNSGRIYIRYSGSSAFQEVKPSAWAYGFYAYMVLFQKAFLHGKDKEFEQVLANVDRLADSKLGSGVPDADAFEKSQTYLRLEAAVRVELERLANDEFGLPLEQSTYSDWREKLRSRWIGFAEDVRTSMSSFGSSYMHRLSSVYIHDKLFELRGGFEKTVEVYQAVYVYWEHPFRRQLIEELEVEAKDFNRRLYGLGSGPKPKPPTPGEAPPPRVETRRDPAPKPTPVPPSPRPGEPKPGEEEVEDEPTTPEPKPEKPAEPPAGPKQGELSLVEMRDRLNEIRGIEVSPALTEKQRTEKLTPYGSSWCPLLLKVTSIETVTLRLDSEESAIYRQETEKTLQLNLARSWYTLEKNEELSAVHTIPPLCLLAPAALSTKLALNLNALNTLDRKVNRYFYPRTPAARLKVGSFVSVWLELDCSTGVAVCRYDVLRAPESKESAATTSNDAEAEKDNTKVKGRDLVSVKLVSDEVTLDKVGACWHTLAEVRDNPELSIREREQKIKDIGKGWACVGVHVNGARALKVNVDRDVARATGLKLWSQVEAIQLEVDRKWYDPRKGNYKEMWFNSTPTFIALKGVSAKVVDELNELSANNKNWNRMTFYLPYEVAAEMKRGDGVIVKFHFDCSSGEYSDWASMTQYAPLVPLKYED